MIKVHCFLLRTAVRYLHPVDSVPGDPHIVGGAGRVTAQKDHHVRVPVVVRVDRVQRVSVTLGNM